MAQRFTAHRTWDHGVFGRMAILPAGRLGAGKQLLIFFVVCVHFGLNVESCLCEDLSESSSGGGEV